MIAVRQLSKYYQQGDKTIHALQEVSFELGRQQTLAVIGPSGSGKTTLLALLAGLDVPSSGDIEVGGVALHTMNEKQLTAYRAGRIAIVFQQFHLMSHLTALENVSLPLHIIKTIAADDQAKKALCDVGLEGRWHHLPTQLSGGECQRVAIARALVVKPQLLLADEPSGNLDTQTGRLVIDLLFSLVAKEDVTMIMVTHDLVLAQRCQNRLQLNAGRLV